MIDKHLNELAWCAVRYALGRMTYVSETVPSAISHYLGRLQLKTLNGIVRDIDEHKSMYGHIGMACDEESWMHLRDEILWEIERRRANGSP